MKVSAWFSGESLPYSLASHVSFTKANKIYVAGGSGNDNIARSDVIRADIYSDGSLSFWTLVSNLPTPMIWHSLAEKGSTIYILGGYSGNVTNTSNFNTVYKTNINVDGSVGGWDVLTPLPAPSALGSSVVIGNRLYYAGGNLLPQKANDINYATSAIYKADINPIDGKISSWSLAGNLPDKMIDFEMMEINNYLYIFGGRNSSGITSTVKRASITPNGLVDTWIDESSLPQEIRRFGIARVNNILIVAGGINTSMINQVHYSNINTNGTISPWQTSQYPLPKTICCSRLASWGNRLYITGGHDGNSYSNNVYISVIEDDIAPPPPPTPTPTPVSKVILIPGLGASWNANAFANCSFDGNPESWSLASYASEIYSPLINQIKNAKWDLKEFYYDWRNKIQNNSNVLAVVINPTLSSNEKVNIVGHSMGGLVGMDYLLGNSEKVNSLLAAGTPFRGSALAYPAWEGGDVWNDNFLAKIAISLFVKHCGNVWNTNTDKDTIQQAFPSIGGLLPAFEYLNDFKTGTRIYPQYAQNTWPNSSFTLPGGVKVETISGTGFDTLSSISVKSPNKHETGLGIWQDGKPAAKQYSIEGDGTVLAANSQIEGIEDVLLTQTHSGLISSQDGINAVLSFLGSAPITSAAPTAQTSALVIIGYPSNFLVTNQNGKTQKDKDGMVAFINPKSGSYKLNLIPKTNNTLFVVAQFLPNGDVKYKEYNLNGYGPKFKTLNFSLENPSEDILN